MCCDLSIREADVSGALDSLFHYAAAYGTADTGCTGGFGQRLSESGEPECITVEWYLFGLLAGPTNFTATFQPWYIVEAKPGIYAYHDYK